MIHDEFKKLSDARQARYASLKTGEALGMLSPEEWRELQTMETGHGFRLDLNAYPSHEFIGMRRCCEPI